MLHQHPPSSRPYLPNADNCWYWSTFSTLEVNIKKEKCFVLHSLEKTTAGNIDAADPPNHGMEDRGNTPEYHTLLRFPLLKFCSAGRGHYYTLLLWSTWKWGARICLPMLRREPHRCIVMAYTPTPPSSLAKTLLPPASQSNLNLYINL